MNMDIEFLNLYSNEKLITHLFHNKDPLVELLVERLETAAYDVESLELEARYLYDRVEELQGLKE